jgi:hypothetical protein
LLACWTSLHDIHRLPPIPLSLAPSSVPSSTGDRQTDTGSRRRKRRREVGAE